MNFPSSVNSKLPNVGTTIFTVMSALAKAHNAINLSQGFPDFNPHPMVVKEMEKALHANNNQYALMAGNIFLRERIAEKVESFFEIGADHFIQGLIEEKTKYSWSVMTNEILKLVNKS